MNARRVPQAPPPPPDLIVLEMTAEEARRLRNLFGKLAPYDHEMYDMTIDEAKDMFYGGHRLLTEALR